MEKPKIDLESLTLRLQELLQCPVCLSSLDETVRQCKNGHGVCGGCRDQLTNCPTCDEEFFLQKPTLLCQMLEMIPQPCPYTDKGCPETMTTSEHKSFCQYRTVDCKVIFCIWKGCLMDLIDHVKTIHNTTYFECHNLDAKIRRNVVFPNSTISSKFCVPCIYKTNLFWVWRHRSSGLKRLTYRFFYLPTTKPTENYYLIVSFKNDELEFKCTVKANVNVDNVDREIDDNDSGLVIPSDLLDNFLVEGYKDKYNYTYQLIKKDMTLEKQ